MSSWHISFTVMKVNESQICILINNSVFEMNFFDRPIDKVFICQVYSLFTWKTLHPYCTWKVESPCLCIYS